MESSDLSSLLRSCRICAVEQAPPSVDCSYTYDIDIEGRGSTSVDDEAYCGSYFVNIAKRYLDEGTWIDVKPTEGAKGHLFFRRYYAQRHEAKKARKKKKEYWTIEGSGASIKDIGYLVVATEKEAEPKKCSGYANAAGDRAGLIINRTTTEIAIYATGQKTKPLATTTVKSMPASCPKEAFRGDFLIEKADLDAERRWVRDTLAKL